MAKSLAVLHEHYGFTMTMSGFEKALKRVRTQRATSGTGQATTGLVTANLSNTLPVEEPAAATGTSLVVVEPAVPPLNRGSLPMKQRLAESRKETGKTLDEGDFIDEWDYENSGEDKHESSSD